MGKRSHASSFASSPIYQEHVRRHEAREHASINRILDPRARHVAREALKTFDARDIRKAEAIGAGRKPRMRVKRGPGERRYTPAFSALIRRFQRVYRKPMRSLRHASKGR